MLNISAVQEYLSSRPIASTFGRINMDEKNDETALKFMCVIDHEIERYGLYSKIRGTNIPKLLEQLLDFHSYKYFTFYHYRDSSLLDGKNLQCSKCELFGPYTSLLTHMATNHNIQIGNKLCVYCEKVELQEHFDNGSTSLQQCYANYLRKEAISDVEQEATEVHQVVKEFYSVLKNCSTQMGVLVQRQLHCYAGRGRGRLDELETYCDEDLSYKITFNRKNIFTSSKVKLDIFFNVVIQQMCGSNASNRFFQYPDPAIVDDENESKPIHQDEPQPSTSTSNTPPMVFIPNTSIFPERSPSSMSYGGTSFSTFNEPNGFMQYLTTLLEEIPDLQSRRETEFKMMEIAMKARKQNPPKN